MQRWGELSPTRDNVVMVLHALTGDSHLTGPDGPGHPTPGWWDGVAGPGAPIDTNRWCAVATNVLGGCRGSTGPSSLARDGKPGVPASRYHVRDQVAADVAALAALGITEVAAVVGGSMGGARALEWMIGHPSGCGPAWCWPSAPGPPPTRSARRAPRSRRSADPNWQDGDYYGTGRTPETAWRSPVALRISPIAARSNWTTGSATTPRGTRTRPSGGRYAVQSYLGHQGDKLAARFDAGTYVMLTDTLSSHDVGRGRGGVSAALGGCTVPAVVGGITSDRLYPLRLQEELADLLPGCPI